MRNFIGWLRYVLDIEKPYSDYESDNYIDRQMRRRSTTYTKIIVSGLVIFGAFLIFAE